MNTKERFAALVLTSSLAALLFTACGTHKEQGYQNYTLQKEQLFVEYSEQYDYWDVITIEYPTLEGVEEEIQEKLNTLMYDTALDRTNYWHYKPDDAVSRFKEDHFSLFCSDVDCDVDYHSQYLLSICFSEIYAPGNPVYRTKLTQRGLNLDLLTGEVYELSDIFNVDKEFVALWWQKVLEESEESAEDTDEETIEVLLSWFQKTDAKMNEKYDIYPYFYLTEEKDFVVGISLDPTPVRLSEGEPENSTFYAHIEASELEDYRTDSAFWEKYEKSEMAGEVIPCENKQENLWLGEGASVWSYWEEH